MSAVNITFLPLSNPLCDNDTCLAFAAAGEASQAEISWLSQFEYGKYVTYYYCVFVAIFAAVYFYRIINDCFLGLFGRQHDDSPSLSDKVVSIGRFLSYRRLRGRAANSLALPSSGISALILLSFLYAALLTFVQRPYYRERRGYGSPPLGVRAGMAGVALTPLVYALAGKYSLVTLITGISHEKLNVLHRWVSYIYLFFGIAHTVPFLVADSAKIDGGAKGLRYQFSYPGSMEYTGIAPFVVLVFLCTASAYWLRRRFYFLFAKSHILGSLAFLGTMFWHCANTEDSWYYLWATLAVLVLQWGIRGLAKTTIFELSGQGGGWRRAGDVWTEILEGGDMSKVRMYVGMRWVPGQHVFLRVPELGMLANHPFTIASACPEETRDRFGELQEGLNEIVFFVRPCRGFTRRLRDFDAKKQMYGFVDGPYGGIKRPLHMLFDNVVLVGGGGGISALLPWLQDLSLKLSARKAEEEEEVEGSRNSPTPAVRARRVELIWCVRDQTAVAWVEDEVRRCVERAPRSAIEVLVFVTGGSTSATLATDEEEQQASPAAVPAQRHSRLAEKTSTPRETRLPPFSGSSSSSSSSSSSPPPPQRQHSPFEMRHQRPYIPDLLASRLRPGRSVYVGCGPESMKIDLSNFAADAQKKVFLGGGDGGGGKRCEEVALYTETFDW